MHDHDNYFCLLVFKFDTLNKPGFKKRKRIALTIENKLEVCKMVKNNVPKSVRMEQFSIGRSTLYNILKSKKSLKQKKRS